ncbi:protein of unknown function [Faunimonas pinastri]|uniref:3'-5' exoribonuclease Rv2179c-like domain-containing protein n=1 Tax=Faunimonas pinastri TaxID=1855383 RepID=A0A1H9JLT3_9HYPH|nr:protein of unknown function [Faunimonas pinastri]
MMDQAIKPTAEVLREFHSWAHPLIGSETMVWSHGLTFDLPILSHALYKEGIPPLWGHRAGRDTRTLFWLAGGVPEVPFEGVKHSPLDDCKHQVKQVIEAYRIVRHRN